MNQPDLFSDPSDQQPPALSISAYPIKGYRGRTLRNANSADLTVAIAHDFTTAGERLTKSAAGKKYLAIQLGMPIDPAADLLIDALKKHSARKLNVAGNGIYTLQGSNFTKQVQVNRYVFYLLERVAQEYPYLQEIRSGGQTGVDHAGLVAAVAIGIPAVGLYPFGYRIRNACGVDLDCNPDELMKSILCDAQDLLSPY